MTDRKGKNQHHFATQSAQFRIFTARSDIFPDGYSRVARPERKREKGYVVLLPRSTCTRIGREIKRASAAALTKRCLLKNPSDVVTDKYRFDKSLAGGTSIWLTFSDPIRISSVVAVARKQHPLALLRPPLFSSSSSSSSGLLFHPRGGVGSGFRCAGLRVVHA